MIHFLTIQVCFDILISREIELFFTFFFSVDIVISMNTSFFFKGFIVKKRKDIIIAYLKSEFLIDLISLIFYIVDFRDKGNYRFLQYLLMLRWKKLGKINLKLQEKFKIPMKIHPSVIDLINLLFFSFYILNMFACCWFYIGNIQDSSQIQKTWLTEHQLTQEPKSTQYFYSIYWSTVTIMTVGYGDITATNLKEVIFSVFTVFFGCGLFAYFINSIGTIVQDINKESYLFK